jgi:hypothetical protein
VRSSALNHDSVAAAKVLDSHLARGRGYQGAFQEAGWMMMVVVMVVIISIVVVVATLPAVRTIRRPNIRFYLLYNIWIAQLAFLSRELGKDLFENIRGH